MRQPSWILVLALCGASVADASAQDVEMLGRRYGTRPPPAYYDEIARDPAAFRFRRGRSQRLEARSLARAQRSGPALALGPREGPVVGTFEVPVLLGLYSNSGASPPFTREEIDGGYFGAQAGTITDYYTEVSGGRVTLNGDVQEWRQVSRPDTIYTNGQSGLYAAPLGGGGAGNFVYEVVALQSLDWGRYDNDGPDGTPNSGDDDGFVDVVAVIHPTRGGECGGSESGDRIWSHRWSLSEAVDTVFETSTPSLNGGFIKVDDYTIQPSISCSGGSLSQIGVFTHELGHAFGLPDLYDTDTSDGLHSGAGIWDLMASGSWGCNNANPSSPCHMGAWSKEQLGWADVITLAPDTDHGTLVLPPAEGPPGTIYRVDANDGSGEYFLLENRQRIGYDQNLYAEGLLVWHIDPDWIAGRWSSNTVNGADHMGVWLRQADGLDQLGVSGGGRGDRGDPFPGSSGNTAFHAVSNPAATSYLGGPTGVTVVDIQPVGDDMELRLLTRFTTLTLRASGSASSTGLFSVDGMEVDPPETTFRSAPFVLHTVEAIPGESLGPGARRPFIGWSDAPGESRVRSVTTPLVDAEYVAEYGGTEYLLDLTVSGTVGGIAPATFVATPASSDFWFAQDTDVTLEAVTTPGYSFLGWSGALEGQPNPASITMSTPATAGADFELIYAVSTSQIDLTATLEQDLQLTVENGTAPYTWRVVGGSLPVGLELSGTGRITGATIDLGTLPVTLEVIDAIGLPARGTVDFEIASPSIPVERLASPFLLSGPALSPVELNFLNRQGNGVSGYDLGDFRAWVLANPSLPMSGYFEASFERRTVVLPMRVGDTDGGSR